MMLIIPSMELVRGKCTRVTQGATGSHSYYKLLSANPPELAMLWRKENAKSLHITDRDSLNGDDNSENETAIYEVANSVDIPLQLYANFPTVESCSNWLENGVFRIVLSTLILDNPDGVAKLVSEYTSSRIVIGVRANNGIVEFVGEYPAMKDSTFAKRARELGISRIIYSDQAWEGTYVGPDPETLKRIARETNMRITASGGIDSPEELWMVQELGEHNVDSVLIGRAIFENRFPCQKIWRSIEGEIAHEARKR
jgi:phosphoribosylformimino-5-aminoimidazole carboxamide ribotide isomerase